MATKEDLQNACLSKETMIAFLHQTALNHNNFKVYTREERLLSWIENNALYLENGKRWNDTDDRIRFNPEDSSKLRFGLCFSFSKSENVAMWMLYGGMHNKGVMLDLRRKDIKQLLDIEQITLGYWNENGRFQELDILAKDKFTVELSDMLYCSEPIATVKRSDTRCDVDDSAIIKSLEWRIKAYPWCYENECRLVISVNKKDISNSDVSTIKINTGKMYQELIENNRIYEAPNNNTSMYQHSRLASRIEWSLCGDKCPGK